MYNIVQAGSRYIKYYFTASNGKGHGIHSPFVFDLVTKILNDDTKYPEYERAELQRSKLKKDHREIKITDFGAGAVNGSERFSKISAIVRRTAKSQKYARLLFRLSRYFEPSKMLELGTSLGVSGSYLALGNPAGKLYTVEGAKEIAAVAGNTFHDLHLKNIKQYTGRFENILPGLLEEMENVDFAFIDGNHRKEPTIDYYKKILPYTNESSILIFDDIHWSGGMEYAWEWIKKQPEISLTVDLFYIGLVFFRKENKFKQNFTIRF